MKVELLLEGTELPFKDGGEPQVKYKGRWQEVVEDQDGDWYFMYQGKAVYVKITSLGNNSMGAGNVDGRGQGYEDTDY